jgi:hypothetical protein
MPDDILLARDPRARVFADISRERHRQEALKAAGKFQYTNADPEMPPGDKVSVIGEEFGEVCCASLNTQGLSTDAPERGELRKELIQLAAVAVAWVEAIDRSSGASAPPADPDQKRRYVFGPWEDVSDGPVALMSPYVALQDLQSRIDEGEVGDEMRYRIVEMTDTEVDALPEL